MGAIRMEARPIQFGALVELGPGWPAVRIGRWLAGILTAGILLATLLLVARRLAGAALRAVALHR